MIANSAIQLSLRSLQEHDMVKIIYKPLSSMEIDETIIWLGEKVKSLGARRLVIDSIYGFFSRIDNAAVLHEKFYCLVTYLNSLNCTNFLISPAWELADSGKVEVIHSVVQGTILLKSILLKNAGSDNWKSIKCAASIMPWATICSKSTILAYKCSPG